MTNSNQKEQYEMAQRPLSAQVAALACEQVGVQPPDVMLVQQFGQFWDVSSGEVWSQREARQALNVGGAVLVVAELS